jgi:hypothetical protein
VGSGQVVISSPGLQLPSGVFEGEEQTNVQTLIPQPAVEALNVLLQIRIREGKLQSEISLRHSPG